MSATCVLTHRKDPERARNAMPDALVCYGCRERMTRDLAELPELDLALSLPITGRAGAHVSGSKEPPLPIRPDAAELQALIEAALFSWSRVVVEDRDVHAPVGLDAAAMASSTTILAAFLQLHLDWICALPFVDEYDIEIGGLRRKAWSLAYPSGRRSFAVGKCTEVTGLDDDAPIICAGMLTAVLRDSDDLLPSEVVCSDNETHTVPASRWIELGRRIKRMEAAS